ncbi:MAG: RNA polymerase sigma factor [Erythrobacter sp.]
MTQKTHPTPPEASALFDQYLVTLAQSGDRRALDRLARRWYPRLLRSARRYVGDANAAESLAQDCWLAISRGIAKLREPAKFAPWAFGILRRLGADRIKHSKSRSQAIEEQPGAEQSCDPSQEDRAAISQAFALLSHDHRFAAHLYFVEGLKLREIALAADVSVGTAKSRIFHARRQLKAALHPIDPSPSGELL